MLCPSFGLLSDPHPPWKLCRVDPAQDRVWLPPFGNIQFLCIKGTPTYIVLEPSTGRLQTWIFTQLQTDTSRHALLQTTFCSYQLSQLSNCCPSNVLDDQRVPPKSALDPFCMRTCVSFGPSAIPGFPQTLGQLISRLHFCLCSSAVS